MILKGKTYWAKVLGVAQPGFDKADPKATEWSFDLSLDEAAVNKMTTLGLKSQIKNKDDERGDFIHFKKKAWRRDKTTSEWIKNDPITVVDNHKQLWDSTKLIGNGSIINVSFDVVEVSGPGGKKFLKPFVKGIQVWEYEEYVRKSEFESADEGNGTQESWS